MKASRGSTSSSAAAALLVTGTKRHTKGRRAAEGKGGMEVGRGRDTTYRETQYFDIIRNTRCAHSRRLSGKTAGKDRASALRNNRVYLLSSHAPSFAHGAYFPDSVRCRIRVNDVYYIACTTAGEKMIVQTTREKKEETRKQSGKMNSLDCNEHKYLGPAAALFDADFSSSSESSSKYPFILADLPRAFSR